MGRARQLKQSRKAETEAKKMMKFCLNSIESLTSSDPRFQSFSAHPICMFYSNDEQGVSPEAIEIFKAKFLGALSRLRRTHHFNLKQLSINYLPVAAVHRDRPPMEGYQTLVVEFH